MFSSNHYTVVAKKVGFPTDKAFKLLIELRVCYKSRGNRLRVQLHVRCSSVYVSNVSVRYRTHPQVRCLLNLALFVLMLSRLGFFLDIPSLFMSLLLLSK